MTIFTERMLSDLRRLPGGSHSFLKQLALDDGAPLRSAVEETVAAVGPSLASRWRETLSSLDNRRFFQGFAEIATCRVLGTAGWKFTDLAWPGPCLVGRVPGGPSLHVMVLSFVRQVRPADRETIAKLARSLDRVGSRSRISVLVRRWLPHAFDPEPVRMAVEMWLREVDRGGWEGRYASYEDEHVSLEFALTGERATQDQGVIAFTLGPFNAQRTLEALERRLVSELDAYRMGPWSQHPVLCVGVVDADWSLSRGYVRELLYGKPRRQTTPDGGALELLYGPDYAPSLFRDPLYPMVSGLMLLEQAGRPDASGGDARAWLSPWADSPLSPEHLPCPSLSLLRSEEGAPVMGWVPRATED